MKRHDCSQSFSSHSDLILLNWHTHSYTTHSGFNHVLLRGMLLCCLKHTVIEHFLCIYFLCISICLFYLIVMPLRANIQDVLLGALEIAKSREGTKGKEGERNRKKEWEDRVADGDRMGTLRGPHWDFRGFYLLREPLTQHLVYNKGGKRLSVASYLGTGQAYKL